MSLYRRAKIWWICIVHQGERVRRSTGTSDKKKAQQIHDQIKAELWTSRRQRNGHSWIDACTLWLTAAPRSESERYSLRAFNLAYRDRPLEECSTESFEEALVGKTPGTFNRYRAMITAILNHAQSMGWLATTPKIPLRKTAPQRIRFLTHEEWERLLDALPAHLKGPARFAVATGLRQRNVTHLAWSQVDLERSLAWVHPEESKSGKPIGVPLSSDAVAVLKEQAALRKEDCPWVFAYRGAPIAKIKSAWKRALERAELGDFVDGPDGEKVFQPNLRWHDLRHTWASWHVMSGTPVEVLQKLGGWSDLRMVMRYGHLAQDYLASFAENAKPWKPDNRPPKK